MTGVARVCRPVSITALLFATLSLAGCGDDRTSMIVRAEDYGDRWPLKNREARLYCGHYGERYMAIDGATYALNGKALRAGMPRPDAALKESAVFTVADFTERAGELCDIK